MDEAIAEIRKAEELDARELEFKANTAIVAYFLGRNNSALKALQELTRTDPELAIAQWGIGLSYEQKGIAKEALASIQEAIKLSKSRRFSSSMAHAQALFGQPAQARQVLTKFKEESRKAYVPSYYVALIHTALGEKRQRLRVARALLPRALNSSRLPAHRSPPRPAAVRPAVFGPC